jgi:hypothetical protein
MQLVKKWKRQWYADLVNQAAREVQESSDTQASDTLIHLPALRLSESFCYLRPSHSHE